jgi:hypothetical protein
MMLMEQCFFAFTLVIEGTTEKVLQFIMLLKLSKNTTKTLASLNKKCLFEHYRDFLTIINLLINIIFVMNFF